MMYHAIWFLLGALCGFVLAALVILYAAASLKVSRPGKPPRTP